MEYANFFAAYDVNTNGAKCYNGFHSYCDFEAFRNTVPLKYQHFYEIIRENDPVNFYFDIDGRKGDPEFAGITSDVKIAEKIMQVFLRWYREQLESIIGYQKFHFVIATSSDTENVSLVFTLSFDATIAFVTTEN